MGSRFTPGNKVNVGGVKMTSMDESIVQIESCINDLHDQAYKVADRYWLFVHDQEAHSSLPPPACTSPA